MRKMFLQSPDKCNWHNQIRLKQPIRFCSELAIDQHTHMYVDVSYTISNGQDKLQHYVKPLAMLFHAQSKS